MAMEVKQVLVTGASGYIGGTVLTTLTNSKNKSVINYQISGLVRGQEQAKLLEQKGVKPILFDDLDASDQLQEIASHFDVVIHTASGFHEGSARALILGLSKRKEDTQTDTHYIHTSGTSNLADQPITGAYHEDHVFSDKEDIYHYEKMRNEKHPYNQRQTDLSVIELGLQVGVKTYIIMSPLIYGIGTGHFNKLSIQIPTIIRAAIKAQQVEVIGEGKGIWDHVHVEDLAMLYEILVVKILAEEELSSGKKGIYFSESGQHTWREVAEGIADAMYALVLSKTEAVRSMSLEEGAERWAGGSLQLAELGFASNSRTRAEASRSLGWKPRKTEEDWRERFQADVEVIAWQHK